MSGNSLGTIFNITTFGESHGGAVGVVIDGCPPNLLLSEEDVQPQLDRRRPGQSRMTSSRNEADKLKILSGVENGRTLGTPIAMMVENTDRQPEDYREMREIPRPSHADYTYFVKYGIRSKSGGGRASARETIGRVAAGAVAEKFLHEVYGTTIVAWVSSVGNIDMPAIDPEIITRQMVDETPIRCPHAESAHRMIDLVNTVKNTGDSIGGVISCICRDVPAGLGEPVFDKLESRLAAGMMSLPAAKGFEVGSGFSGTRWTGSLHNDPFVKKAGRLGTLTNNSGGIQGGISNGEPIFFRVAFKPTSTITLPQNTVDFDGNPVVLAARGRHDPCVAPRAVPIVESMAALAIIDFALIGKARTRQTV